MEALLLAGAALAAAELALRLPLARTIAALRARLLRIASVIRSPRISDTHKERVLPVYALRLASLSLALLGMVMVIALPLLVVGLVAFHGLDAFAAAMIDPWLLILMVAVATAWFTFRRVIRHGV